MDFNVIKKNCALFSLVMSLFLQGCASSDLSRTYAGSIDNAYLGVRGSSTSRTASGSISDAYQNSSQTSKGALMGGVAGGIIGGFTNGVGVVPGAVTGAILGGALGAYIDAHTTLVDRLENRGAKVFVLGDHVLIVLPSNKIFDDTTPNIRVTSYSTLNLVAELIGNYVNMSVTVAAYTNGGAPSQVALALSKQQAERVAKYLWKQGVNTRLLYAVGYGDSRPVTRSSQSWNCSENYRIEITFEKLPVC